ncbi:MAG: GAF domain-containing protein [Gaiellaceae bacterium]
MGSAVPEGEAGAAEALERATTVPDLLRAAAVALVEAAGAQACSISRVLGDALVILTEYAPGGESLTLGQGHLVTDFPLTQEVIRTGEARAVTLLDDGRDPQEAAVLEELGFDGVLMMPLPVGGECWALVEIYTRGRATIPAERAALAEGLVARAGALVEQLL